MRHRDKILLAAGLLTSFALQPLAVYADHSPPDVQCGSLQVHLSDDKNYYLFTATATGNTPTIISYQFDFGDKQSYRFAFAATGSADHASVTVRHTYERSGTFHPSVYLATAHYTNVSTDACSTSLTINPAASSLPNTGFNSSLQVFAGATLTGITFHQVFLRRRVRPQQLPKT